MTYRSRSNRRCQGRMWCLAPLSPCSAGAETPGMPFPACPCPAPAAPLPPELTLAHLLPHGRPASGTATEGSLHPLAPCSGTWPRCSGLAPQHSPHFHARHVPPWVSLKCLFVPSLTARLKSSYPRQRERNILQVCNSLKRWTRSNRSLLSGRKEGRHVQTVVYSNTPVEFGSTSTDWNSVFWVFCLCQETQAHKSKVLSFLLAWFRLVPFQVLTVDFKRVISTMPY